MVSLDVTTNLLAQAVRAHRESRGLSLGNLAEKAGISKTSLSKIESGLGNPSLEVLCRIAQALNVPIGTLFGEDAQPPLQVIRRGEGQVVTSAPGVAYHSLAHAPGTEEFIICVEGDLRLGPKAQEVLLQAGDAVWFPADLPHMYESASGARALLMMSYPPALSIPR